MRWIRARRQVAMAIWLTKPFSVGVAGWYSASKRSRRASKSAGSSPGRMRVSAYRPYLRLLRRTAARPSGVDGPVLFWALRRLVRHPPRSGWLDEWDRLKGGHLLSLGVALRRAFVNGSELAVLSIRGFLLADVLADLLQFKADRGDSVTAGPEMFAREIPLLTAQPGNGDCTLPL